MTAMIEAPSAEEIARVKAWEVERARIAQEREDAMNLRRPCSMHGPGPTGRMLYGRAPYGYGPVCKFCRKEWSRRNGGVRWLSDRELREIAQEKREAVIAEAEAMSPADFYVAWTTLMTSSRDSSAHLRSEIKPDLEGSPLCQAQRNLPCEQTTLRMRRSACGRWQWVAGV